MFANAEAGASDEKARLPDRRPFSIAETAGLLID
jgi:hypothetical protein